MEQPGDSGSARAFSRSILEESLTRHGEPCQPPTPLDLQLDSGNDRVMTSLLLMLMRKVASLMPFMVLPCRGCDHDGYCDNVFAVDMFI